MGPIAEIPEFPVFDAMEFEKMEMVPYKVLKLKSFENAKKT